MFHLILLTVIFGSTFIEDNLKLTLLIYPGQFQCWTPLFSSNPEQIATDMHKIDSNSCTRNSRCKNYQAEVSTDVITCHDIQFSNNIGSYCYLWGSDRWPDEQMLFIFLLRINANSMILHYFNSSQQYLLSQHLCTASSNLDIVAAINGSCMDQENPPEVLPNEEVQCCRNINVSINFYDRMMEILFYNTIIKNPNRSFKLHS